MTNNVDNQFDWIPFYKELANKLLEYRDNQKELIEKIKHLFEISKLKLPKLEKDNNIKEIDPFSVFSLFNTAHKDETRLKIIEGFGKEFPLTKSKMPESLAGAPTLPNQKYLFYDFSDSEYRGKKDIDELWELFDAALSYEKNPKSDNKTKVVQCLDVVVKHRGVKRNATTGLYWIAPDIFVSLDKKSVDYIYGSNQLPKSVVKLLPEVRDIKNNNKFSAEMYFKIIDNLKSYFKNDSAKVKSFYELSYKAGNYQEDNEIKEIKPKKEKVSSYTKKDFLKDVFMSEEQYNTLVSLLENNKNLILQGPPGVGKTFTVQCLAHSLMGKKDKSRIKMVQFHQNYSYEDFVMGYKPNKEGGFELKNGVFYDFCKKATNDADNKYFFIIDEINRGNMSKVFGEVLMLIEKDKRKEEYKLQLAYAEEDFYVPENVYIIGMMNTADRSLAIIDYALRRRFCFFDMRPAFDSEGFKKYQRKINNKTFDSLIGEIKELNKDVEENLGKGFCIGHSYFSEWKECTNEKMSNAINYEIIPLLEEYWFDNKEKREEWKNNLQKLFK